MGDSEHETAQEIERRRYRDRPREALGRVKVLACVTAAGSFDELRDLKEDLLMLESVVLSHELRMDDLARYREAHGDGAAPYDDPGADPTMSSDGP